MEAFMNKKSIILFLSFCILLNSCAISYNIQVFDDKVHATKTIERQITDENGKTKITRVPEGEFKASTYDEAMRAAYNEGYTKVLSVEYGINHILGIFYIRWVKIRCTKDDDNIISESTLNTKNPKNNEKNNVELKINSE